MCVLGIKPYIRPTRLIYTYLSYITDFSYINCYWRHDLNMISISKFVVANFWKLENFTMLQEISITQVNSDYFMILT